MGLFSSLRSKQLAPAWTFSTSGVCWRLLPTRNGLIVGEDRNVESKTVSFFCIDRLSGREVWKDLRFATPWWIGLESIQGNVVLLHEYATPDMPDHRKIIAVDLFTGKLLWEDPELKFLFSLDDRLYAAQQALEQPRFFELELESGRRVGEIDPSRLDSLRTSAEADPYDFVAYASPLGSGGGNLAAFERAMAQEVAKAHHAEHAEVLLLGGKLAMGYYDNLSADPGKPSFRQHLSVLSAEGRQPLYEDTPTARAAVPVPDTFFGIGDMLYYIREQSAIVAVNCSEGAA
jgi:hypothetical protein